MNKMNWLWLLALCAVIVLTAAFGTGCAKRAPKPLEQPLELQGFTYRSSGMHDSCRMVLEKAKNGTKVTLELGYGMHTVETVVEDDLLGQLSALATEHRMDLWDGFDKADKRVLDGEMFEMRMVLSDGRILTAHGSNAYPDNYHVVIPHIEQMINDLTVRLTDMYPKHIASDAITYVNFEVRGEPVSTSEVKVYAQKNEDGTVELNSRIRSREDLVQQDIEVIKNVEAFPFDEVQNILSAADAAQWNGWSQNAADGEDVSLYVRYDSGETLEIRGTTLPDGFDAVKEQLTALFAECIIGAAE